MRHRVEVVDEHLARDQPGEVRHVDHERRVDLVGDLAQHAEIHEPRIRAVARDKYQRPGFLGAAPDVVVLQEERHGVDTVGAVTKQLSGDVGTEAVGEVAPSLQGHPEQRLIAELLAQSFPVVVGEIVGVPRLEARQRRRLDPLREDRPERDEVGVDAAVRLGIHVRRAEECARELVGARFDDVDVVASGIEAVPGRALGVLVAEPVAHREQHGRAREVLACDQLEVRPLVGELVQDGVGHGRLDPCDGIEGGAERDRLERHLTCPHAEAGKVGLQQRADGHERAPGVAMAQAFGTARRSLPGGSFHLSTPVTTSAGSVARQVVLRGAPFGTWMLVPNSCSL